MANSEHLQLLPQGVENWNEWRKQNPQARPDLSQALLYAADLSQANTAQATLARADLKGAKLTGAARGRGWELALAAAFLIFLAFVVFRTCAP